MRTRYAVNGLAVSVVSERERATPPLLMLHGFTGDAATWGDVRAELGPAASCIAVDLVGHGETDHPRCLDHYHMPAAVADLATLLDLLGLPRVALLGYSMGGRTALQFAVAHPERVSALLLESSSPGIADPAERAVKMAMAMREASGTLIASWRRRGRLLGFGAGIAQGYATLGQIGFAERSGYTAIGTVCNLAARLCAEAQDGQILIGQRVAVAVEETITLEEVGSLTLKGLTQPVVAYNVPLAAIQPALRVIEGGPQSV